MTAAPDVVILADHSVWLAVPALGPAIIIAGVVFYIARKNRKKTSDREDS